MFDKEKVEQYIEKYKEEHLDNLAVSHKRYYGIKSYDLLNEELDTVVQFWGNYEE